MVTKVTPLQDAMTLGEIIRSLLNRGIEVSKGFVVVNTTTRPYQWKFCRPADYVPSEGEIYLLAEILIDEATRSVPATLEDNIEVVVSSVAKGKFIFSYRARPFWTKTKVVAIGLVAVAIGSFFGFMAVSLGN